jgi:single-strand DNA-binding protein
LNGPQITVVGHVAASPRLRALAGGTVVADFRVAMTPSRFDKTTEAWVDLETLWFNVSCWRALGEHAALSFNKGDKVVVTGTLSTRSWTSKEGEARTNLEIDATSVGMDLTRGPVIQKRVERTQPAESAAVDAADPWAADQSVVADPVTGEILPAVPDQSSPEEVAA